MRSSTRARTTVVGTEFQMHKTQHPLFDSAKNKLIDFTEHKLLRCMKNAGDMQQQAELQNLIASYKLGNVAIAWRQGQPTWFKVTKEK